MKGKSKYNTIEEKKQANRNAAKKWYYAHKDTEEFKKKRNEYHRRYYNSMKDVKKEVIKAYNRDYIFYVKSVITGRFEKKIVKTKEQLKELTNKLNAMQNRLEYLTEKFGHLVIKK